MKPKQKQNKEVRASTWAVWIIYTLPLKPPTYVTTVVKIRNKDAENLN